MEKISFIINELSIQKMPGLPRGLSIYRELSPGINIIYGANGAGKSSTARAIRQLLWAYEPIDMQAETTLTLGSAHWDIKLNGTRITTQKNGINAPLTGLPTAQQSERYLLAMHELITKDDSVLAHEIIKESIGGYDLEKAGKELQYTTQIKSKAANEYKAYQKASADFDNLKKEHESLKREEAGLDQLKKQKEQAEKARELKGWYEKLLS